MIVEIPSTEIIVEDSLDVTVGSCEVEVVDLADLDVTVSKKEYVITGDEIYIPMLYDDAPQWMKDLVQIVVDVAVDSNNTDLINRMTAIVSEFATSYVPLNQYTQSIIDLGDEDTRINGLITTLNSNLSDGLSSANAQIIEMQLTKASKSEVVAQIIQTLSAQLADNNSNIGAIIGRIDQAIADETSARASSFELLTSSLEDTNLDVTANATATSLLNTYVGLELGAPNGTGLLADVVALASDVTMLSTELDNGTNTWASADSNLENSLMTEISDEGARVESKFAYNNTLMLNGTSYSSGFGIATSLTSGSGLPTGQSEFWIKADKFKLMSADGSKKSSYSPFTVDSVTGEINFNGKVTFSNVTGAMAGGSNLLYNSAPEVGRELEGWSKGYNTVSGFTHSIAAGYGVNIISGGSSILSYVIGTPANNSVFDIQQTKRIPVESNTRYELSAYLNCYRCVSEVRILWITSNGDFISEPNGTQVSTATATTKISDWGRSTLFATSPSNASSCAIFVRSYVTGTDPHCFVARAYFGKALDNQTGFSAWSEGTGPSKSSSEVVTDINNGNTTTINGGKITTGSITANQIQANSVSADRLMAGTSGSTVWTGGGLVSQNFNGNVNGAIGSPTAGFRLSSDAAGTSADPNIYGAYIKGATLEGSALTVSDVKVKAVGYVNNFGPLSLSHKYVTSSSEITTYATSDIFYGRNYSSGYLSTRMCPSTLIFTLTVTGSTWVHTSGDLGSNYAYIQVSVNGGAWTTIYTSPALRMQLGGQYDYTANTLDNIQFRAYINNTYSSTKLTIVELDIQATNYGS